MASESFRKKVSKELKKLDRGQVVNFAWRCGVRALPFIGGSGNFNFWKKKERQKYIYAIFYALDINASNSVSTTACTAAAAASNAATTSAAAAAASAAAFFAATATSNATATATPNTVFGSAAVFGAAATADADTNNNMYLEAIILQDLKTIQNVGEGWQFETTEFYGEVWSNFQKALKAEGCSYWGKLYKSIFDNEFVLDQKALEKRMNVPKEIREQGAAAVANFLEKIEEKGAAKLNEARIIILGDKGSGKTCMARRLMDPNAAMTTENESTAGVDTTLWNLEKENINVRIWDFAGHTVTHAVHQFFLSERCLYLIVYNSRTDDKNRLEYWLDHMKNYGGDSKAIILVNKRDQHSVKIPINSLKEQYAIAGVYTFSIGEDKNKLETFRNDVAEYIKNNPSWEKQAIPQNYYDVKEELENLFVKEQKEKGKEHITKEDFETIAARHDVDNIEELLKDLHSLGVSLWYQDMQEFDTLILNPEWISHGVYKIINWVNEEKKYSIKLSDFVRVFKEDPSRYPADKHKFLFNLIKHYELAYETNNKDCLIIPHLLNEDRPAKLPAFPVGESLMLRYKAEQPLPPNTISRFIVRHNREIKKAKDKDIVWRYGVVLEDGKGSLALVREEDRTISVTVKGKNKTNYISALRETLNDIFNSYKSANPELQYKVVENEDIFNIVESKVPLLLTDRKIFKHSTEEVPYYDDLTGRYIFLNYTINQYNISAENVISGGEGNKIIKTTFNFRDCNIDLQSNLNELAQLLTEGGNKDEAIELENAAKVLEQTEKCTSKEEVKKKGIAGRLKRLAEELADEDSKLHKTVKGIKNGISIAQDIAKGYNDIAQWVGLPQVPKPFL